MTIKIEIDHEIYTVDHLRELHDDLFRLKLDLLSDVDESGSTPIAEVHLAKMFEYLNLAIKEVKLAEYEQMRG